MISPYQISLARPYGSIVIGIKHKAQENFCMAAMLFYILPEIIHLKRCRLYFIPLKLSVVLMSPIPCICHFIIIDQRQLKCLMGWPSMAWSLLSFLKVGLVVQKLVWGTARAGARTHTHHITSHHIDPVHLLFTLRKGTVGYEMASLLLHFPNVSYGQESHCYEVVKPLLLIFCLWPLSNNR